MDLPVNSSETRRVATDPLAAINRWFPDPRLFQIAFLGLILTAGVWFRDLSLAWGQIVLCFAATLTMQRLIDTLTPSKPRSYRSALITALSLTLLLRADNHWAHPLAGCAAISSKFLFRFRGKHLFNPANLGVIFALLCLHGTWVSPGQWGQDVAVAGWLVVLGTVVTRKARRDDVSWTFLAFYLGAIACRVAWLGQRWAVWDHQLSNGALLLFAFFMISDPMTAPNAWRGRIAQAGLVAFIGYFCLFELHRTNTLLWALFFAAFAVPLWDLLWPAEKFEWNTQGDKHENSLKTQTPNARSTGRITPRVLDGRRAA
jgi:Na+-transporting NADH:ubiquinone oxidoreductase subunit NqrB